MDDFKTLRAATDIAAAYVSNNSLPIDDLPALLRAIHGALGQAGSGQTVTTVEVVAEQKPAVSIGRSIKPDYLICLEDGKRMKLLKRYLRTNFGMTPDDYRSKWKLPFDYPMVAPNYRDKRSAVAKSVGLGKRVRRTSNTPPPPPEAKPRRGRKPKDR